MWRDEKKELRDELELELQWVQYRMKMLNIIEAKLLQMREIAVKVNTENCNSEELETINDNINYLAAQVRAIDTESRRPEDEKIL